MSNENSIATHFIVAGDNQWAKGSRLKEAFYGWMARSKPSATVSVSVFEVDADAYVDEIGGLHAKVSNELPDIKVPKAIIEALNEIIETVEDGLEV